MSRVIFGPLPIGAQSNYDQQLARWLGDQVTLLSRLLTRATDVTDRFAVTATQLDANISADAGNRLLLTNSSAGASATAFFQASNGTQSLFMVMHGTGHSGGFASQAWLYSNGTAVLILGAGSAEAVRIKPSRQMRFFPLAADPAGLEDGDVWYNSTAGKLRVRAGGVTIDLH